MSDTNTNLLNISNLRIGGGKSQPSIRRVLILPLLLLLFFLAFFKGYSDARHPHGKVWVDDILILDTELFYCPDSLMYYAERAYMEEDPLALCITGTAAYQLCRDYAALDSLTIVPIDEADIMLLRSAELGCHEAVLVIRHLNQLGLWHHAIPEEK